MKSDKPKRLLVIIVDRLSELVKKGEMVARYYNPGNLFDEVHILMTNDDVVDPADVQKTVGTAKLYLHNLPSGKKLFIKSLGWQAFLLKDWVKAGVQLVRQVQPALIRAHGNHVNGYLAAQIRKRMGVPLIVSLHCHPDADVRRVTPWWPSWCQRLAMERSRMFERETLSAADRVIIVYKPQREYAIRNGARDVHLIYNIINPSNLQMKIDYRLHDPPRIISVGRQFKEKNPENVIRAVSGLDATLTLVGDGAYHNQLENVAQSLGIGDRIQFLKAVPNDELCRMLPSFDIFATHNDYWGIPKAVLEPLLCGLPVVINRRKPEPIPELDGDLVLSIENTAEAYQKALAELLTNHERREALGRRAYVYAWKHFAPPEMEQKVVDLYRELVPGL